MQNILQAQVFWQCCQIKGDHLGFGLGRYSAKDNGYNDFVSSLQDSNSLIYSDLGLTA